MEITFFGLIYFFVYVGFFICNLHNFKKLVNVMFILCVISTIFLDTGFVFRIGGFYFEFNYLATLFLFVSSLLYLFKYGFKNDFYLFILLLVLLILNLLFRDLLNVSYQSCGFDEVWDDLLINGSLQTVSVKFKLNGTFIRFFLFGIILSAFSQSFESNMLYKTAKVIGICSKVYLIFLLIEMLMVNVFHSNMCRNLVYDFFGKDIYSFNSSRLVFSVYAPMGLAREPSNLACTFLYVLVSNLYLYKMRKQGILPILLYFVLSVFIGSFGAFLHLLTFVYLLFITSHNKKFIGILLALVAILTCIINYERFISLISFDYNINNLSISSENVRLFSIVNVLVYWLKSPLFGVGIGTIYAFSPTITLLANFGIVGSFLFIMIYSKSLTRMLKFRNNFIFYIPILLFSFSLTGHLGYLLYFEKTLFLFLIAKDLIYNRRAL